jgi:hypothetical protein
VVPSGIVALVGALAFRTREQRLLLISLLAYHGGVVADAVYSKQLAGPGGKFNDAFPIHATYIVIFVLALLFGPKEDPPAKPKTG